MSQDVHSAAGAFFRRIGIGAAALGTALAVVVAAPASADTIDVDGFESYALGEPTGQFGWTAFDMGGYNAAGFDIDIADPSSVWTGGELGTRALRLSNAVSSLAFGNQLQTPSLLNEAGETAAVNGGVSGGTRQSRFSGSFTFASATQTYQPGLAITFSPDRGDGTRMTFFRISDQPGGLLVEMSRLDNSIPAFVTEVVATDLPRDQVHTLEFSLDLVDGTENDVLWMRVGGECGSWAQSGSWETYHRLYGGGDTQTVDSLLIRISAAAVPALSGNGLFIDNLTLESSTVPAMPPLGTPVAPPAPTGVMVPGGTTTVTAAAVTTNGCAPVTEYIATATPLGAGAPITYSSPTPTFSFPTPFGGAFTLTVSAVNSEGRGPESERATFTINPVFADDDELALTGAQTGPLGLASAALIVIGTGAVWFSRRHEAAPVLVRARRR